MRVNNNYKDTAQFPSKETRSERSVYSQDSSATRSSRNKRWSWKSSSDKEILRKNGPETQSSLSNRKTPRTKKDLDKQQTSVLHDLWPWKRKQQRHWLPTPSMDADVLPEEETSRKVSNDSYSTPMFDELSELSDTKREPSCHETLAQGEGSVSSCTSEEFRTNEEIHWAIQVLSEREVGIMSDQTDPSDDIPWFRIYFHNEDDYVYFRGEEILDYVKDLVELDGTSMFSVFDLSLRHTTCVKAHEIVDVLAHLILGFAYSDGAGLSR